jgi:hypothetical protein
LTTNADGSAKTYLATLTVSDAQFNDDAQVQVTVQNSAPTTGDDFNRSCNTPDLSCELLNDPQGQPGWVEAKGNLIIKDFKLKNTLKGDNIAILQTLSGATTAEADFTSVDNNWGPRLGVVLGYHDPLNYHLLYRTAGGTNAVRVSKVANGVETILSSKALAAPVTNVPFHLKGAVSSGNVLTLTIGPPGQTPLATLSVTSPSFSAGNSGILLGASFALQYSADNFSATNQ